MEQLQAAVDQYRLFFDTATPHDGVVTYTAAMQKGRDGSDIPHVIKTVVSDGLVEHTPMPTRSHKAAIACAAILNMEVRGFGGHLIVLLPDVEFKTLVSKTRPTEIERYNHVLARRMDSDQDLAVGMDGKLYRLHDGLWKSVGEQDDRPFREITRVERPNPHAQRRLNALNASIADLLGIPLFHFVTDRSGYIVVSYIR